MHELVTRQGLRQRSRGRRLRRGPRRRAHCSERLRKSRRSLMRGITFLPSAAYWRIMSSAYWWNSAVSDSIAFLACVFTPTSSLFSSSFLRREISHAFLCSACSMAAASLRTATSLASCRSSTLHHSCKNSAVSASSVLSRSRWLRLRSICAILLFSMSATHFLRSSSFSWSLRLSESSFSCTCLSMRWSSVSLMAARRAACWSMILALAACFALNTSSSFFLRRASIFSFLMANSSIFCSSLFSLSVSSAFSCLRYWFAC
mmetsp:Transcript_7433/g.20313  ORF Transcript_7433/g.20313 Transcript_7433/m.20313 type:complete len:261 (-) Transcript_7433:817-1599(-)